DAGRLLDPDAHRRAPRREPGLRVARRCRLDDGHRRDHGDDETDCVVDCAQRMVAFYAHESCGKCTPCREGSWWATRVLERIEDRQGRDADLPVMKDIGVNILFRAFCALADGTASVINSSLAHFADEYEEHVRLGRCPMTAEPAEEPED